MKMKKISALVLIATLALSLAVGCSQEKEIANKGSEEGVKIIASTSWVAAIAEAAGAQNVNILAPVELKHPPEYDFKPSDVQLIIEADWILMAGYEPFMNKMIEANKIDETKIIKVNTTNTPQILIEQTRAVAEKIGTKDAQSKWEEEFTTTFDGIVEKAKAKGVESTKVLVNTRMEAFVRSLGFHVLDVFGADELSPAKIGELVNLKPDLIIDNFHNPQGKAIADASGIKIVEIKNFPGSEHNGLIDLIVDNAKKLNVY